VDFLVQFKKKKKDSHRTDEIFFFIYFFFILIEFVEAQTKALLSIRG